MSQYEEHEDRIEICPTKKTILNSIELDYKFNEGKLLEEIKAYIDSTYKQHYAKNEKIQVTEFIQSQCDNIDFLRGNALKYICRFGSKEGFNKKDLMKAIHYCLLMWHFTDK